MAWNLNEAIDYYKTQGAPRDQSALIGLLREIQQENKGSIPLYALKPIADCYGIKETFYRQSSNGFQVCGLEIPTVWNFVPDRTVESISSWPSTQRLCKKIEGILR